MNVQTVRLNLDKRQTTGQVVRIGQGDSSGTTVRAEIYDGEAQASLDGMTATLEMRLPGGRHYYQGPCTVSGNVVEHVFDESHAAAVDGRTKDAYIEIRDGDDAYSTGRFKVVVLRSADDGADVAVAWSSDIEGAARAANEAAEAASSAADQLRESLSDLVDRAESAAAGAAADTEARIGEALGAITSVTEQAVPLMSADARGGARLGDGLAVSDGALETASYYTTETAGGAVVLVQVYEVREEL